VFTVCGTVQSTDDAACYLVMLGLIMLSFSNESFENFICGA